MYAVELNDKIVSVFLSDSSVRKYFEISFGFCKNNTSYYWGFKILFLWDKFKTHLSYLK